jgi:hypothetical protein
MSAMHWQMERSPRRPIGGTPDSLSRDRKKYRKKLKADTPENNVRVRGKAACDKVAPGAAVMLHLRFCYVSKAAILTIPIPPVSVENRSPA